MSKAAMLRFEHKLSVARVNDQKMEDLTKYLDRDKTLKENFKSDDRADIQRAIREQRQSVQEQYTAAQLQAAREAQEHTRKLRDQDERLAVELTKRKVEAQREAKNIQRICEQSEELRDLEEKLKQAYLNKEREVQIEESNVLLQKQEASDAHMAAEIEAERQRGLMAEQYREHLRRQDGRAMKEALDQQMQDKLDRRALAAEEFLREKAEVDAVVAAIEKEEENEREAREAKEASIRKHIEEFVKEREKFKHVHAAQLEAEKQEIRDYANRVMERETAARMATEKDQNAKDAILEKLSADMAKRQLEADEMENLRNELVIQETEERIIIKEREKAERAAKNKADIALANEYQRQLKAIRREEEKAEEERFRRSMLDKFAEDDRLDQMNAQKRRMKMQEHKREVERLASVKRAMYEEQMAREVEAEEAAAAEERAQAAIVEEERKRLLVEHAARLKDFLPKGVLAAPEDLDLINTVTGRLDEMSATGTMGRAGTRAAGSKAFAM